MDAIREVTVFALGDSRRPSTWSNVPYFFTRTLEDKGIRVNRVDLSPSLLGRMANRLVRSIARRWHPDSVFDYSRSLPHYLSVKRRIAWAVRQHPEADTNIFLTFSFSSAGMSDQRCVLFGDWTYDHCFRHFLAREPSRWERASVERENREIESADLVIALFPSVAEAMKRRYANPKIIYAGNVVNALIDVDPAEVLQRKLASRRLLFIGGPKYIEGARQLLRAHAALRPTHPDLEVHIVGLRARDLGATGPGVVCHGYLDKEIASERELYYDLLLSARAVVNTTPKWAAFSAMIEAMYFYTPTVVTPYDEFVKTFGGDIDFGCYCPAHDDAGLHAGLQKLLQDDGYADCCRRAHDAVKDFTWSAYIDRVLDQIARCVPHAARAGHAPASA